MTKKYTLYMHVNKINNKKYIGITKRIPKMRWGSNGSGYRPPKNKQGFSHFYNAIQHYGWDSFEHLILFENLSKEEAGKLEIEYIAKYNTQNPDFGYNETKGGRIGDWSAETLRKLELDGKRRPIICLETGEIYNCREDYKSTSKKDNTYVTDACNSLGSRVHDGKHWLFLDYYKTLTEEETQDIKEGKLQNHHEVVCLETGEVFWDATKAGQTLKYGKYSIANRCNHFRNRKSNNKTGGYHWAYKEDYENLTSEEIEDIINEDNNRIVCIETKVAYESAKEAARDLNIDDSSIYKCCKGEFRTSGGYHWMYERDYKNATKEDIMKRISKSRKKIESIRIKEVICLETREVFENIKIAAKVKNASEANISISCKCQMGQPSTMSGGYHWMFLEDYNNIAEDDLKVRMSKREIKRNVKHKKKK